MVESLLDQSKEDLMKRRKYTPSLWSEMTSERARPILSWVEDIDSDDLVESAWERQMNIAGMEQYDLKQASEVSETIAGQKVIRKLIKDAEKAIKQLQKDIVKKNRVEQSLKGTLLLVPASTLALLTLKAILDGVGYMGEENEGRSLQPVSKRLGQAVEDELNFRTWLEESRKASREYAKAKGLSAVPKSQAERIVKEQGVNRKTLWKYKETFKELTTYEWTYTQRVYCGEALILTVTEAIKDYFTVETVWKKGATNNKAKIITATEKVKTDIVDLESRIAASQVIRKPMLTAPIPWTAKEQNYSHD